MNVIFVTIFLRFQDFKIYKFILFVVLNPCILISENGPTIILLLVSAVF